MVADYLAMVLGAIIMTMFVQSLNVFPFTFTQLAGADFDSLDRAYHLTLGSILGTTASFVAGKMILE